MIKYLSIGIGFILIIFMAWFQFHQLSKFSKIIGYNSSMIKNEQKPKFIEFSKEGYIWCYHNCVRYISRRYGMIEDYDRCNKLCEARYGKHY